MKWLLVLLMLLFPAVASGEDQPFWIENLTMSSELNIYNVGNMVNTRPAGQFGFLTVSGTEFIWEDTGTTERFYGTNLSYGSSMPSKANAEKIADLIGMYGIEIVRLHHIDYWSPNGLFPAAANTTTSLDATMLDQFDYFMYQLKQHGIYANINLCTQRIFQEEDAAAFSGLQTDLDTMTKGGPWFWVDEDMQSLMTLHGTTLLTHTNPYTGLAYKDDPMIAFIEVINEESLFQDLASEDLDIANKYTDTTSNNPPPSYVLTALNAAWNTYLDAQYGTYADVITAWGLSSLDDTATSLADHTSTWTLQQGSGGSAAILVYDEDNDVATIDITAVSATNYHIQYKKTGVALTAGENYTFAFTAKSDNTQRVNVFCQSAVSPYASAGLTRIVELTEDYTNYVFGFTSDISTANAQVVFNLSYETGDLTISDILFAQQDVYDYQASEADLTSFAFHRPYYVQKEMYPAVQWQDYNDFLIATEKAYYDLMFSHLRNTVGVHCPIIGQGGLSGMQDNLQALTQSGANAIDFHQYYDHPLFPSGTYSATDFTYTNKSMIQDPNWTITYRVGIDNPSPQTTPITLSEYNIPFPNMYAYEALPYVAAYARTVGESGLSAIYEYGFAGAYTNVNKVNNTFFDTCAEANKKLLYGISSYIFNKATNVSVSNNNSVLQITSDQVVGIVGNISGNTYTLNNATIAPTEDGAVFLLSADDMPLCLSKRIIVVLSSTLHNTGDDYTYGSIDWGSAPTLMTDITATITMPYLSDATVFKLNTKGEHSGTVSYSNNTLTTESGTYWYEMSVSGRSIMK